MVMAAATPAEKCTTFSVQFMKKLAEAKEAASGLVGVYVEESKKLCY